ncbi:MAG: T9SS type A sorting domain-containing protein [Flavobacteriales bacterium]
MESNKKFSRRKALKSFFGLGMLPFIPFRSFASQEECITTDDIEGPFFIEGAPNISVIAPFTEGVARMYITGTIYAKDCTSPIPNALIDVWQANDEGGYEDIDYRGKIYSDENGNYSFESIQPGKYLNGANFRPSHIHFKVTYLNNPSLVTQLYFEGDTSIDIDPWASDPEAADRIIPLATDDNQNLNGVFDIYLNVESETVGTFDYNRNDNKSCVRSIAPNPIVNEFEINFYTSKNGNVKLDICDVSGRLVKTIFEEKLEKGLHKKSFRNLGLKKGIYVIRQFQNNVSTDAKRIFVN